MKDWEILVCSARDGDTDAFGFLVPRFQDMAVGYGFCILGDFDLAEDAAQEAFIEAFRDLPTLREPRAFPSWLRRIVFKQCDRLTRRKRIAAAPLDAAQEVASADPGPRRAAEKRELQERVLAAVRSLPEGQRAATTLYYINGYTMAEVGEFLDVPVTTVKSRLHSARGKLRERMTDMVDKTLKEKAPQDAFSKRVLSVIEAYQTQWRTDPTQADLTPVRDLTEKVSEEADRRSDDPDFLRLAYEFFHVQQDGERELPLIEKYLAHPLPLDDEAWAREKRVRWIVHRGTDKEGIRAHEEFIDWVRENLGLAEVPWALSTATGIQWLRAGKADEWLAVYERMTREGPQTAENRHWRFRCAWDAAKVQSHMKKDFEKAFAMADRCFEIAEEDPESDEYVWERTHSYLAQMTSSQLAGDLGRRDKAVDEALAFIRSRIETLKDVEGEKRNRLLHTCMILGMLIMWHHPEEAIPLLELAIAHGKAAPKTYSQHIQAVWRTTKDPEKVIPLIKRAAPLFDNRKDYFRGWHHMNDFPELDDEWNLVEEED